MLDAILFTLGLAAGLFTHEAGHMAAGWATGEEVHFRVTSVYCDAPCENIKTVAAGGFVLPAIASEALLFKKKRGPFEAGWLAYNILSPVAYTIRHEAFGPTGDLAHFSRGEARIVEGLAVAHAATVALRWAWKDKPEWFEIRPHEDGVAAAFVMRW